MNEEAALSLVAMALDVELALLHLLVLRDGVTESAGGSLHNIGTNQILPSSPCPACLAGVVTETENTFFVPDVHFYKGGQSLSNKSRKD